MPLNKVYAQNYFFDVFWFPPLDKVSLEKQKKSFFHFPPLNKLSANFPDLTKKHGFFTFFFKNFQKFFEQKNIFFFIKKNFFKLGREKNFFLFKKNFFLKKKMTCKLSVSENDPFYFPAGIHNHFPDSPPTVHRSAWWYLVAPGNRSKFELLVNISSPIL